MKQLIHKRILPFIMAFMMSIGVLVPNQWSFAPVTVSAAGYYDSISATAGDVLLGQLHDLITTTHTRYTSYDDCKVSSIIRQTDAGSNGNVMEFYSQADISSSWGNGAVGTWNREHVWCQSLSNGLWGESGGGSDLHHIRPSESSLNSTRGNNKFGIVTGGKEVYYKGTGGVQVAPGGYVGGSVFEPLDQVKGDVARIVMYVYTHYNTYANVHGTTNGKGGSFGMLNFTHIISASNEAAAIELLLRWNREDPVDSIETARNNAVCQIQGNRNPFIDNQSYAEAIWGDDAPVTQVQSLSISPADLSLNVGLSKQLSVTVTPQGASDSVTWSTSDESVVTVSPSGVVTAKGTGTATVTATSKITPSVKNSVTVTVTASTSGGEITATESVTIDLNSFELTAGYGFKNWTSGELSGMAFIYGGSSTYPPKGMQFNKKQTSHYLASDVAAPGGILSVTVKLCSGETERPWRLLTSNTAYGSVTGKPTEGVDHGIQTVTADGVTWYLDGSDLYFALTYELDAASGACYLESITVEYGVSGGEKPDPDKPDPDPDKPKPDPVKVEQFKTAMAAIEADTTVKASYSSIYAAIEAYSSLTEEEKAEVQAEAGQLQATIDSYNEEIAGHNATVNTATQTALKGMNKFFQWVGALIEALRSVWL